MYSEDLHKQGAFDFEESDWFRWKKYKLEKDNIKADSDDIVKYNPFDFYANPVPTDIVNRILQNKEIKDDKKTKPMYLHTLFASIDTRKPEQVVNFVNSFGLPFFHSAKDYKVFSGQTLSNKHGLFRNRLGINKNSYIPYVSLFESRSLEMPLQTICEEINRFKVIIEMINIISEKKVSQQTMARLLGEFTRDISYADFVKEFEEGKKLFNSIMGNNQKYSYINTLEEYFFGHIEVHLESIFNSALECVSPKMVFKRKSGHPFILFALSQLQKNNLDKNDTKMIFEHLLHLDKEPNSSVWSWRISSLLSGMYLMLFMDSTAGKLPRVCGNSRCGRYFLPTRNNGAYCSGKCQENAKGQRFKEKNKKIAFELWKNGKTPDEISAEMGIELNRIVGWVNKFQKEAV